MDLNILKLLCRIVDSLTHNILKRIRSRKENITFYNILFLIYKHLTTDNAPSQFHLANTKKCKANISQLTTFTSEINNTP